MTVEIREALIRLTRDPLRGNPQIFPWERGAGVTGDVAREFDLPARGAFAANDPRLARAAGGGSKFTPGLLARLLGRFSGTIGAAFTLADVLDELSKQRQEQAFQGAENVLKQRLQRRNRERDLRQVLVRSDLDRLSPAERVLSSAEIPPMRVQSPPGTPPVRPADSVGQVQPGAIGSGAIVPELPFKPVIPEPTVDPGGIFEPVAPGLSAGAAFEGLSASDLASDIASEIAQEIASEAAPQRVFGTPAAPAPIISPVQYPVLPRTIWGNPGLTVPKGDPLQSALPDPFGEVLDFPDPVANPRQDPARQRRCKPCKEDNPKPRERCFKGLYREGALDTQVDFTKWAEIDCITGVEL